MLNLGEKIPKPKIEYFKNEEVELEGTVGLPVRVTAVCPACGIPAIKDFRMETLFEPAINKPLDIYFYHPPEVVCRYVWPVKMVLRIGLFEALPAVYRGWGPPENKIQVVKALRLATGYSLLDCKNWVEAESHNLDRDLALKLQEAGAQIEWRF